ncbi:DNA-binding response regulator [Paraconexibacter algicola]|uniref:DNA-binding response regulator n=2 Tax=Thermoleophilia TaxID=1497346 RepID=A0A2T4UFY9_9ACTN|nr:DNA-binding response regulator [Paraconexibacter algicola]
MPVAPPGSIPPVGGRTIGGDGRTVPRPGDGAGPGAPVASPDGSGTPGTVRPRSAAPMPGSQRPIRVFLCDDVDAFRALMRVVLEEDPAIVVCGEAADGAAGVDGVDATRPDVVLLDLAMPGMDGMEAIPLMRERAPRTRILALSGFTADRLAAPVIELGADGYIEKGEDVAVIRRAIHDAAQRVRAAA